MTVETKNGIFSLVQAHQSQIRQLGVSRLGLFGSFVRDEQNRDSDVDVFWSRPRASVRILAHTSCARSNMSLSALEYLRSIEVIGEATKQIPNDFKRKYSHLEWRAMAGMRDRLIHSYFGIDYDIVWDVATEKAPALHQAIKQIIAVESQMNS